MELCFFFILCAHFKIFKSIERCYLGRCSHSKFRILAFRNYVIFCKGHLFVSWNLHGMEIEMAGRLDKITESFEGSLVFDSLSFRP